MATKITWKADPEAEVCLAQFNLKWKVVTIQIVDIDLDESAKNHARLIKPIDQDVVLRYGLAMERGDAFPMPVAVVIPGGRYKLLGGNHRTLAALATDATEIDVYLVEKLDAAALDLVPRALNAKHGEGISKEDRLRHALWAVVNHSYDQSTAATIFGIPVNTLANAVRADKVRARLRELNIDPAKANQTALLKLTRYIKNDNLFNAAGPLLVKMSSAQADTFTRAMEAHKSEAAQLEEVKKWADIVALPQKGAAARPVRAELMRALGVLSRLTDKVTYTALQVSSEERTHVADQLEKLVKWANRVANLGYKQAGK